MTCTTKANRFPLVVSCLGERNEWTAADPGLPLGIVRNCGFLNTSHESLFCWRSWSQPLLSESLNSKTQVRRLSFLDIDVNHECDHSIPFRPDWNCCKQLKLLWLAEALSSDHVRVDTRPTQPSCKIPNSICSSCDKIISFQSSQNSG